MWGSPSSSPSPHCLPQLAGISISFHFRTVAANSNNFQTHPVCNLLSTYEIKSSENIFNNHVMQNGIRKIVESGKSSQFQKFALEENFILKSGRLQPHCITQRVECTSIYSPTIWHRRIAVIVQKGPSTIQSYLVGGREGLRVFRGAGRFELRRLQEGRSPCRRQIPRRGEEAGTLFFRGTS